MIKFLFLAFISLSLHAKEFNVECRVQSNGKSETVFMPMTEDVNGEVSGLMIARGATVELSFNNLRPELGRKMVLRLRGNLLSQTKNLAPGLGRIWIDGPFKVDCFPEKQTLMVPLEVNNTERDLINKSVIDDNAPSAGERRIESSSRE